MNRYNEDAIQMQLRYNLDSIQMKYVSTDQKLYQQIKIYMKRLKVILTDQKLDQQNKSYINRSGPTDEQIKTLINKSNIGSTDEN